MRKVGLTRSPASQNIKPYRQSKTHLKLYPGKKSQSLLFAFACVSALISIRFSFINAHAYNINTSPFYCDQRRRWSPTRAQQLRSAKWLGRKVEHEQRRAAPPTKTGGLKFGNARTVAARRRGDRSRIKFYLCVKGFLLFDPDYSILFSRYMKTFASFHACA